MTNASGVKERSTGKKVWIALLWSLILLTIIIMLALTPSFLGYRPVRTFGSSMEPALHDGDALLVKHVDAAKVRVGDIVTLPLVENE